MAKLKLTLPKNARITQYFGQNAVSMYTDGGLKGHPAIDYVVGWDSPITDAVLSCNKKYVYSPINDDNPDRGKYRGVACIIEADDGVFELIYGHCNDIKCKVGAINYGDVLATEGNTGDVFVGGRKITTVEKNKGSQEGHHVHFQLRLLSKVRTTTLHSLSLQNGQDFVDEDGYHFDVPNFNNGYNGCVDPMPFIQRENIVVPQPAKFVFKEFAKFGDRSETVRQLQIKLGVTPVTGYWWIETQYAFTKWLIKNGIWRLQASTDANINEVLNTT